MLKKLKLIFVASFKINFVNLQRYEKEGAFVVTMHDTIKKVLIFKG